MELSFIYNPVNSDQLIRFFFVWIIGLFVLHMIWDKCSSHTTKDNWKQLDQKLSELYAAATIASSLLLGFIMLFGFNKHPLYNSDIVMLPLLMAVLTGINTGLSGLKPKANSQASTGQAPTGQPTV